MSCFNARYLTDEAIWAKVDEVIRERSNVEQQLADPEIHSDQVKMPQLARRLLELEGLTVPAEALKKCLGGLEELEEILAGQADTDDENEQEELQQLKEEYLSVCVEKAAEVYNWLLDRGYLGEEIEDETDLKILNFIDYAGPEYAWRLGINVGLDVKESRRRLEELLGKGLLERVEGKMLENYHREKSWTKHMNHTYYRISREGRLYLRKLRRAEEEDVSNN